MKTKLQEKEEKLKKLIEESEFDDIKFSLDTELKTTTEREELVDEMISMVEELIDLKTCKTKPEWTSEDS
jgi:uncharacterized protein YggL (DUF469 family)